MALHPRLLNVIEQHNVLLMANVTLVGEKGTYVFDPRDPDSKIAEGGMGVVYAGINEETGLKVAIKVIYRELAQNPSNVKRAAQEAAIQIDHPNLLQMMDFVELDEIYHVVSEFLEGQALDEMLNGKRGLGEGQALKIMDGVLAGLATLHKQVPLVVHRDVKPSNIFICTDGTVKLMDFGIAKISGGKRKSLTGMGLVVGTPYYSAPEQVRGKSQLIGPRTDVYSTGITLYEALSGRPPFDADSEFATLKLQVEAPLPDHERIHPQLFKVLRKATQKDPAKRFATAEAFKEALDRYREGVGEEKPVEKVGKKRALLKWKLATIALGILAVIFCVEFISWRNFYMEKNEDYVQENREKNDLNRNLTNLKESFAVTKSSFRSAMGDVADTFPFQITKISLANRRSPSDYISSYGSILYHDKMRYLSGKITCRSNLLSSQYLDLRVKIYKPNGTVFQGSGVKKGFSREVNVFVKSEKGIQEIELGGFGSAYSSSFDSGSYRYEVWYGDVCLGSRKFYIYY